MAHFNLDEQEQISKLKYFWRDYGKYIIGFLIIVIVAFVSSEIWSYKAKSDSKEAALIYAQLTDAISSNDNNKVYSITDKMETSFPKTEYTVFASLWAAKLAVDTKNTDKAISYINWVIKNAKDKSLVSVAKLRLADIYIDQKKIKEAVDITMEKVDTDFQALFYAKRGDLYLVTNDKAKAIDAYKAALQVAGGDQELVQAVQMKLDVLGN